MPRTTLVLATLTLAGLMMASPIFVTAQPTHAGDPGPPDHAAAASQAGPPDDARPDAVDETGEASSVSPQPSDEQEATEATGDPVDEDRGTGEVAAPSEPPIDEREDETVAPAGAHGPIEPATRTEPVERRAGTSTPLPAGSEASPTTSGARSSTAPGLGGAVKLLGPVLAVSVLGVGLVARARVPDGASSTETDDSPETDAERAAEGQDGQARGPTPPTPGPVGLLTLGRQALDRGDVEAAADWFRTATLVDPSRQVAHFCLGLCLAELDELEEAEAALAEARRSRPGDVEAAYAHAQVLARRGSTRKPLRTLERLADEMPGLAERLRGDEAWMELHDHPRWLALTGQLPDLPPEEPGGPTP